MGAIGADLMPRTLGAVPRLPVHSHLSGRRCPHPDAPPPPSNQNQQRLHLHSP